MAAAPLANPFFCESRDNFPHLPPLGDTPDAGIGPDDSVCSAASDCDLADGLPIELRSDLGIRHFPLPPSHAPVWNLGEPCANVSFSWLARDYAATDAWWRDDALRVLGESPSRRAPILRRVPREVFVPGSPVPEDAALEHVESTPARQRPRAPDAVETRLPHGRRALLSPAPLAGTQSTLRPHPPQGARSGDGEPARSGGAALAWPFTREQNASSGSSGGSVSGGDSDGDAFGVAEEAGRGRSAPLHVHWGLIEAREAPVAAPLPESTLALSTTLEELPLTPRQQRVLKFTPVKAAAPGGSTLLELSVAADVASWTGLADAEEVVPSPPPQPADRTQSRVSTPFSTPAGASTPVRPRTPAATPYEGLRMAASNSVPAYISPALQRRHASGAPATPLGFPGSRRCDACGLATVRKAGADDSLLLRQARATPIRAPFATPLSRSRVRGGSPDDRFTAAPLPTPSLGTPATWGVSSSASGISVQPLTPAHPQHAADDEGSPGHGWCACLLPPEGKPQWGASPPPPPPRVGDASPSSPLGASTSRYVPSGSRSSGAALGGVLGALAEVRAFSSGGADMRSSGGAAPPDYAWDYALWRSRGAILPAPSSPMSPSSARPVGAGPAPPLPAMPPVRWLPVGLTAGAGQQLLWPGDAGGTRGLGGAAPAAAAVAAAVAPRRLTFVG